MSKIKLSILLLIVYFIFSCTSNQIVHSNQKYSVSYIGGEFDGLLLKNYLVSNLKNLNLYDQISNYKIRARIVHSSNLFITNTDNTSDRERVSTTLYVTVENLDNECQIYSNEINVSQFYIYASSDKFLSNQKAFKEIKKDNTETTVKQFINELLIIKDKCDQ
tara:strand:+ start:518 stop:1006 length:489 start_codon:yes stop_codon:yes gene_type:complete